MIDRACFEFKNLADKIKSLSGDKPVVYVQNSGNMGDALIRLGTLKFFQDHGIRYIDVMPQKAVSWWRMRLSFLMPIENLLVYAGGGGWCRNFDIGFRNVLSLAPHFKSALVLPTTYEFRNEGKDWPENITFFARDKFESQQNIPSSIFCHDMAFYLGSIQAEPGRGEKTFFRTDRESAGSIEIPKNNIDLSSLGNVYSDVDGLLKPLAACERIKTDRLHVAIAAGLMGREVILYESNYFKIRAIYKSSLEPYFPNIKLEKTRNKRAYTAEYSDYSSPSEIRMSIECKNEKFDVFFKSNQIPLSQPDEALVSAAYFPFIMNGIPYENSGVVSRRFKNGLKEIIKTTKEWGWVKEGIRLEILKEREDRPPQGKRVASFFSGGVDSFYTLMKHRDEITDLIFIHGFDIPIDSHEFRKEVSESLRSAAEDFGKNYIEIETNIKTFLCRYTKWDNCHGAVLATVAHLISGQFRKIYIPSTFSYDDLYPWGSHPDLDPHWSSDQIEIAHDGCEANKLKKISVIVKNPIAMKTLRVCWENRDGSYNCGKCGKCLRTIIGLKICGLKGKPESFPTPLTLDAVRNIPMPTKGQYKSTINILNNLKQSGDYPELREALEYAIKQKHYLGTFRGKSLGLLSRIKRKITRYFRIRKRKTCRAEFTKSSSSHSVNILIDFRGEKFNAFFKTEFVPLSTPEEGLITAVFLPCIMAGVVYEKTDVVSERFRRGLEDILRVLEEWGWAKSDGGLSNIGGRENRPPTSQRIGCFFTGGVDSFYEVLTRREEITDLIFVHGFDIPLSNHELRKRVSGSLRKAAADLGKNFIEIETNLRDFLTLSESWREMHGVALATVAHILSGSFGKIYIPSTYTRDQLFPWGSHPALDPKWSSDKIDLVHGPIGVKRIDKIKEIVKIPIVLKTLRVCLENRGGEYNCGRCEKCLRTMIALRALGVNERSAPFASPLNSKKVRQILLDRKGLRQFGFENLIALEESGIDPELEEDLRYSLNKNNKLLRFKQEMFRKIRQVKRSLIGFIK